MMKQVFRQFLLFLAAAVAVQAAPAEPPKSEPAPGKTVAVVYNNQLPESKDLALYYAKVRDVPATQVWGFDLPENETVSRQEFLDRLQKPLLEKLTDQKLWVFGRAPKEAGGKEIVTAASVRYLVLCYGVPLKILRDAHLHEAEAEDLQPELRRTDAAVDSQLAVLPWVQQKLRWSGPLQNPVYGLTNAAQINPTRGILLVSRLDGPSPAIARGLVDKAMEAETNGLWGRAYFDARGFTNGTYELGDKWIREAARASRRLGFETVLDNQPATFPESFPMSRIAFYAGWYDGAVSGPFTRPDVEFMPGAFAYHLHSYSAQTIRSSTRNWVGPLLAKGATITMGSVEEPYLAGTPDIATFFTRFVYYGFSFGEAAYASQNVVSWQTTVVGDPLYRPFGIPPPIRHYDLEKRHSPLVAWSHLRVVDLNLSTGLPIDMAIQYLKQVRLTDYQSILQEKLGDLYAAKADSREAIPAYRRALSLNVSPQQKVRLFFKLAGQLRVAGHDKETLQLFDQFLKECPDYPDERHIYEEMLQLARRLQSQPDIERVEKELNRLDGGGS